MVEKTLALLPDDIPESEIFFLLGYANVTPTEEVLSLYHEISQDLLPIVHIRYLYENYSAEVLSDTRIRIGDVELSVGKTITQFLQGMTTADVFVVTAGSEYSDYLGKVKAKGDIFREFMTDAFGTVIAETAVAKFVQEMQSPSSIPYTPGYCSWNITEQKKIFSLLPSSPCGVVLSDSCLMYPEKSVSGFVAHGEGIIPQKQRCSICPNTSCYNHGRR